MKSHATVKGHQIIDWKKVFNQYKSSSVVDASERNEYLKLIASWDTCPCGQAPAILPRTSDTNSAPVDNILTDLGKAIYRAFEAGNYDEALNLLDLINIRVKFLLKEAVAEAKAQIVELEIKIKNLQEQLA